MSRLRTFPRGPLAMLIGGAAVLGLYLLLLVASFVDPAFAGSSVGRNITFAGTSVSGVDTDELHTAVLEATNGFDATPVEIDAGEGSATTSAGEIGLGVDVGTSSRAIEEANDTFLLARPTSWIASFFGTRDVDARYEVDQSALSDALVDLDVPGVGGWVEPRLVADANGVGVEPGTPGAGLDTLEVARLLEEATEGRDPRSAEPIVVTPTLVEVDPPVSDADTERVAADAETATSRPLAVTVGETEGVLEVATLRSWLVLDIDDTDVDWGLDHERALAHLEEAFAEAGSVGSDVAFVVDDGGLRIEPGADQTLCCDEDSTERVEGALRTGRDHVELPLRSEERVRNAEWAESLGIVEEVASFTTFHDCCQNRVVNIHLIADSVRGVVIEPGETFSLNGHVGRRTADKGYLPAGGITQGVLVDQLGGGISQFTTTLFNAAFFAGLDFGEYQAHSIYFSRYPYGREATLSYPAPDLQIRNTSPYGVLIWPTYTDTSITVTLYSTRHVTAEQTGQSESMSGVCTVVRTERTRTWDDGRVEVDHVMARYRPREGVNCSGEPSVPTTEPPPPEPQPEPPPEPQPEPPPDPPPDNGGGGLSSNGNGGNDDGTNGNGTNGNGNGNG